MSDVLLLGELSADRALASQVLFPHRHPQESPPAHVEIVELWRSADEFVVIEAAREFGKTSLAEEFLLLEGCYGNFWYCLVVGETYDKACERIAAIDYEARTNVELRQLFGGGVLAKKSNENRVWFKSGALIQAVGWEQELQSFKHNDHRPDRAYLDDPENQERVRDAKAVDESMRKLYLELIPALDKVGRKVRITQTRRAEDCMVTRLAANPKWLYRSFPVCDGDPEDPGTKSNWPARYPMEWVRSELASYTAAGMRSEFLQSYLLQVVDPAQKPFRDTELSVLEVSPWHWMARYVIYDPSRTTREKARRGRHESDRTGKVVVSRMGSKILVHESGGYFWQPDELLEDLFVTQKRHRPAKIGVEQNSLNDWLLQPIRIEMMRRGESLPLVALQAPQDRSKEEFILGLQPFAQAGDVVLVGGKAAHAQLVAEWSNFPSGPRDVLNALAYALRMFAGVPMYENFGADNIADAPVAAVGETVFVGVGASAVELVAVAALRERRRLAVAFDFAQAGALGDGARILGQELRATFPRAVFQVWVAAELFDQQQRIGLIGALRGAGFTPYRGAYAAVSRGTLSTRINTIWKGQRALTVDRRAQLTLNALSAGYALPVGKGGRTGQEPEPGVHRLLAEALESMVAMLDAQPAGEGAIPANAHVGHNAQGHAYVTANPRAK